jgi:hypothetical protein
MRRHSVRSNLARRTISPAVPPVQPSRFAIRSRTGRVPLAYSSSWKVRASYQWGDDLPEYCVPNGARWHATSAQAVASVHGTAPPRVISTRVPAGKCIGSTLVTVVVPSRSGRSPMRRLRVVTASDPLRRPPIFQSRHRERSRVYRSPWGHPVSLAASATMRPIASPTALRSCAWASDSHRVLSKKLIVVSP